MANADKNIVITPSIGSTTVDPKIVFSGANTSLGPQNITLQVYPTNSGTLSFEGSAGQLFSITNDLTGTIFSVNDVSGIPSIDVNANGNIKIAEFSGNVNIGSASSTTSILSTTNLFSGSISLTGNTTSFRQNSTSSWSGDAPNGVGKLEYHSNRWYINAGEDSTLVAQFRRGASDVANINNSGVYSGSIAGNAATATILQTARNIGGVSFNGSANIDLPGVNTTGNQNTSGSAATLTTARNIGGVSFNGSANIDLPGVNTSGNQNTSGSAATLTTARNIGGVSFNGSANIDLPGVNTAGNQNTSGNAATVTDGMYLGASQTVTGVKNFQSNLGASSGSLSSPPLQAFATGGNSAFMSFHRSGSYAVNMGLDSDNILRIGGWSAPANLWQLDMSGNNTLAASSRAPIFYDSNNTGYYVDPASTSEINKVYYNSNMVSRNYGIGQVGLYNASRYQAVFSMGESYLLAADGTGVGSLYGIAWSHPNAGGAAGNLASHGMLILENGTFKGAWGGGRLVTTSDIRGTLFYDYDNTAYYVDPANLNYLYHLEINGANHKYLYINPGNGYEAMVRYNGGTGSGWYVGKRTATTLVNTTDFHFYSEAAAATVGGIDTSGNIFASGSSRAPIFYDNNNTSFYIDPNSTGTAGNFAGTINAVDFNSTSDRALKENFLPIENALNKVKQLTGWTYNFKSDTNKKRHAGIVAQDLLEILPEAVTGEPGNYKVAYSNIIGLLVEAIKEQQKQIEQLLIKE
jgi:hypothetical protein